MQEYRNERFIQQQTDDIRAYKIVEATLALATAWNSANANKIPSPEQVFPSLAGLRDDDDDEHLIAASYEAFKSTATQLGR